MKFKIAMLVALLGASSLVAQAQKIKAEDHPSDNSLTALPDLVVKEVRRQKPGSDQIEITITNTGKGDSRASHLVYACVWHPQANGSSGAMFPSGPIAIRGLKPGEIRKLTRLCEAPPGKKIRFSLTVDVNKEVAETNEQNNKYYEEDVQ
jgi:hypothetical protein